MVGTAGTIAPPARGNGGAAGGAAQAAPAAVISPFTRAARENVQPMDDWTSAVLGAAAQQHGPVDVPAFGYLRAIVLLVQASGGVAGGSAAVLAGDAPWNIIQTIQLNDVNGQPIVGPLSGYELYIVNKYGGYQFLADPTLSPAFATGGTGGNATWLLRLPIEITARDGLGCLPNQNAASTYKVTYTVNTSALVFATAPGTTPVVRTRLYLEAWSQPLPNDPVRGQPQATIPPAMGTTQFWSHYIKAVSAGAQTVQLPRVGNLIRMIAFLLYSTATPSLRTTVDFPDPSLIVWDSRQLLNEPRLLRQEYMMERYGYAGVATGAAAAVQLDTGVFVYDLAHDMEGHVGWELRNLYLPTTQATRLELQGTFGAAASSLTVLTNDVAPTADVGVY